MVSQRDVIVDTLYGVDSRERVNPALKADYEKTFSLLKAAIEHLLGSSVIKLDSIVVHSPIARPIILQDADRRCLIYDQFLGDIFATLTRLVLSDSSLQAVDSVLISMLARRNLVVGRFERAALLGLLALRLRAGKSVLADPAIESLASLIEVQEMFAIAHELAHLHLERTDIRSTRLEQFKKVVARFEPRLPVNDSDLRELAAGYAHEYNTRLQVACEERNIVLLEGAMMSVDKALEFIGAYRPSLDLLVDEAFAIECLCDAIATDAVLAVAEPVGVEISAIASGITLASHHLRWLQAVDYFLADERTSEGATGVQFRQSIARLALGRSYLRVVVERAAHDGASAVLDMIHELTVRHDAKLGDPTIFCMEGERLVGEAGPDLASVAETWARVEHRPSLRALLGFA
jgi:hypothetical protein